MVRRGRCGEWVDSEAEKAARRRNSDGIARGALRFPDEGERIAIPSEKSVKNCADGIIQYSAFPRTARLANNLYWVILIAVRSLRERR